MKQVEKIDLNETRRAELDSTSFYAKLLEFEIELAGKKISLYFFGFQPH
ncbi:hypothetical protein [Leeuwenhoekiella aestuarii]|uniref:Uncharacterized protein n=1 Tax=Leeuwenhoekiella aestuarii TaxID=2249426 RepID=A0A4Q0NRL5_9FLAO|nr:hypothetical protein [Leeuwenhoekiella aestuarii]RXG13276.1 hypothetical protein DSM04_105254 [Leeuwenhoekiella aestuarii]